MAEAHSAVTFSVNVVGDDLSIFYDENLFSQLKNLAILSWKRFIKRCKNNIHARMYPNNILSLILFFTFTLFLLKLDYLNKLFPFSYLSNSLGINLDFKTVVGLTFIIWLFYVYLNRLLLRILFSDMSYMYSQPKKTSLRVKIWFFIVKLLSSTNSQLYSYQDCLPKLSVPSLNWTIKNYLKSVQPLLSEEDFISISKKAEEFRSSYIAKKMQFILWLKSMWTDNYVTDWWEEYVYLASRASLMSNSNFYGMGTLRLFKDKQRNWLSRAAFLTSLLLRYGKGLENEKQRPLLIQRLIPLCSNQYTRQYNTTRIPRQGSDVLKHYSSSTHLVVLYRGKYFKIPVRFGNQIINPCEFEYIYNEIVNHESEPCIGENNLAAFTTAERNFWANKRAEYFSSGLNRHSLDIIEKAAFVVVLQDEGEFTLEHDLDKHEETAESLSKFAMNLLCGSGSNRWFDKSFTYVFGKNGQFGVNSEHSWADGPITSQQIEQVLMWEQHYNEIKKPYFHYIDGKCSGQVQLFLRPQRIKWSFSEACVRDMDIALKEAQLMISNIDMHVEPFVDFGRERAKQLGISPDSLIQIGIQAAIFEDFGKFCLTYEASMTRLFKNGRTETVRSCTSNTCAFVRALNNEALSNDEKMKLLREAGNVHQNNFRNTMSGKGIDRHIFALYILSRYFKVSSPFLDYAISQPWRLSTSQTPMSQCEKKYDFIYEKQYGAPGGGFGPVTDDGYGVSYIFSGGNMVYFHVSSKKSCQQTDSRRFGKLIAKNLRKISQLFDDSS